MNVLHMSRLISRCSLYLYSKRKADEGRRFLSESSAGGRQKVTLSSVLALQRESEAAAHERELVGESQTCVTSLVVASHNCTLLSSLNIVRL